MFRRIFTAIALVAAASALLIIAWPQLFGLQRTVLVAQAVSLRGLTAVVAIVIVIALTLFAMLSRSFRRFGSALALVTLAFALVNVAVLATRGIGSPTFSTKSSSDVTVLSWNTLGGAPGSQAIATLALHSRADVVSLPETTKATADAVAQLMKAAGHPMSVHTIAFDQVAKARSTSLLVSTKLGEYRVDAQAGSSSQLPTIIAKPSDGSGPTIVAVHAVAPVPGELADWRADLSWLASVCAGTNTIMAGDFNATIDHFVGLGNGAGGATPRTLGNCTDAGVTSKNAAVGTWPTSLPALFGAPIDHVMVTPNWKVTGMRVIENLDKAGSDHRPIVVQLQHGG
ncbi:MAG: endonuclease/exonuclease/phosphatase family protein [Lacisediminihabitans sp.]